MRSVQNFNGTHIAYHRPHKNTYIILKWHTGLRQWAANTFLDTMTFTKHQKLNAPIVSAVIHAHKQRGPYAVIQSLCSGEYLKSSTNEIIPILKRKDRRTDDIPQSCIKREFVAALPPEGQYYTNEELYTLADPVEVAANKIQIGPQAIPRRIANIVAIDYITKGEDCPITMMPLDISTAKVTSCFHVFDAGAIDEWLKTKKECPVCKTPCIATAAAETN
jgi:hypothetical protein